MFKMLQYRRANFCPPRTTTPISFVVKYAGVGLILYSMNTMNLPYISARGIFSLYTVEYSDANL